MTTLEDQIRRYATDVAGPAVAGPPDDLLAVGRPRHRGRWVLVAALVVFIVGLTWVATRPSELGEMPSVDTTPSTVPTTPTTARPADAISWPGPIGPCTSAGPVGVMLSGPSGEGLCVGAEMAPVGPGAASARQWIATVFVTDGPGGGGSISPCFDAAVNGEVGATMTLVDADLVVVTAQVPTQTATARALDGAGPTLVAFDLPGFEGTRFVSVRVPDQSWGASLRLYDASGDPVIVGPTCPEAPGRGSAR